jgi:hypothetical protein
VNATAALPMDAVDRAFAVEGTIEAAWRWATRPIDEAQELATELAGLAARRDLPYGGLRALTQVALGVPERPAVVDRWLEDDPEVTSVLGRVRKVSAQLDGLPSRARIAVREAMALALKAPTFARAAIVELWGRGPSPDRDPMMRTLERLPHLAKARAQRIREEASIASALAERAREQILEGVRPRGRATHVTTQRLHVVPR